MWHSRASGVCSNAPILFLDWDWLRIVAWQQAGRNDLILRAPTFSTAIVFTTSKRIAIWLDLAQGCGISLSTRRSPEDLFRLDPENADFQQLLRHGFRQQGVTWPPYRSSLQLRTRNLMPTYMLVTMLAGMMQNLCQNDRFKTREMVASARGA